MEACAGVELRHRVPDVRAHGLRRDLQLACHLLARIATRQEREYLALAIGQTTAPTRTRFHGKVEHQVEAAEPPSPFRTFGGLPALPTIGGRAYAWGHQLPRTGDWEPALKSRSERGWRRTSGSSTRRPATSRC